MVGSLEDDIRGPEQGQIVDVGFYFAIPSYDGGLSV